MTQGQTLQCARCGFENGLGDQFCGSCGAFLEWEGTAVAGAPAAVAPGRVADAATADAASPPATSPASSAAPADGLLRCPACGIANPADRTFCQTCGAKLIGAVAVAPRSRDEVAAAVASVAGANPAAAASGGPRTAPARAAAPSGRGGLPGWIVAVVVLGVLVGVAAVAASDLLKGNGPSSIASFGPSAQGGASSAGAASASTGASLPPATAGAASTAPGPLRLTGARASSVAAGDTANYGPQNAIDGSIKTSWQEGAGTEKGQWIEISFDPATVTGVVVRNGFQASTALFKGNLRLKDVLISVDGGKPLSTRLKDITAAQQIALAPVTGATRLRITIVTTYPSIQTAVRGTPFDDAAVSEIGVLGVAGP